MLHEGQPRPRATSCSAWRTVGAHWLMFCQSPAIQSKSVQPSTACAGTNPRPRLEKAINCKRGRIVVLKYDFIANLLLV
jgi:hypothetical protein